MEDVMTPDVFVAIARLSCLRHACVLFVLGFRRNRLSLRRALTAALEASGVERPNVVVQARPADKVSVRIQVMRTVEGSMTLILFAPINVRWKPRCGWVLVGE